MRRGSFREQVRAAARELEKGQGFLYVALEDFLGIRSPADQKRLQYAVQHLVKAGEFKHLDRFRLSYPPPLPGAPSKQQIMWRYLRMNRRAGKEQLRAAAQASERTVKDFAQAAVRQGLAEVLPDGGLRLLGQPGPECPFDEARADRAQRWRERRKEALAALDQAYAVVARECPGEGEGLRAIVEARARVVDLSRD